jgi:hypothetical protein
MAPPAFPRPAEVARPGSKRVPVAEKHRKIRDTPVKGTRRRPTNKKKIEILSFLDTPREFTTDDGRTVTRKPTTRETGTFYGVHSSQVTRWRQQEDQVLEACADGRAITALTITQGQTQGRGIEEIRLWGRVKLQTPRSGGWAWYHGCVMPASHVLMVPCPRPLTVRDPVSQFSALHHSPARPRASLPLRFTYSCLNVPRYLHRSQRPNDHRSRPWKERESASKSLLLLRENGPPSTSKLATIRRRCAAETGSSRAPPHI